MSITKGKIVDIHYTLKNDNGEILDSSKGQDPLQFQFGTGTIIKGLETELEGKNVGDKFIATVSPENAYGIRSEKHIHKVPITQFDSPEKVQVGARFQVGGQGGTVAEVIAVDAQTVTIDTNHPLADQVLHFDVEVVDLKDASSENLNNTTENDCCSNGTCSSS